MSKFKTFIKASAMGCLFIIASCDGNESISTGGDNKPFVTPENVLSSFSEKFPNAQNVSWTGNAQYAVASFYLSESPSGVSSRSGGQDRNTNAWFLLSNASWEMTDTDIPFSSLPQAVIDAFNATEYSQSPWVYDNEVDVIFRNGNETLYIIEAKKKENNVETEVDLYFTEDGMLVKEIIDAEKDDDHSGLLPEKPADSIAQWLEKNFPGARVIDIENEDGGIEVEFIADGKKHEALFDRNYNWLYTKTDLMRTHIDSIEPAVLQSLRGLSVYTSDNAIDDIERYNTLNAGIFYKFELETRFDDVDVYIAVDGNVLEGRPSLGDGNTGFPVNEEIDKFISERYPNSVIKEKDYDDGYIEVEIIHDGKEKEVVFNGKYEWIKTVWEISMNELPEIVKSALTAEGYRLENIDDVEVVETPKGVHYRIELERNDNDIMVVVDSEGNIVSVYEDR